MSDEALVEVSGEEPVEVVPVSDEAPEEVSGEEAAREVPVSEEARRLWRCRTRSR